MPQHSVVQLEPQPTGDQNGPEMHLQVPPEPNNVLSTSIMTSCNFQDSREEGEGGVNEVNTMSKMIHFKKAASQKFKDEKPKEEEQEGEEEISENPSEMIEIEDILAKMN